MHSPVPAEGQFKRTMKARHLVMLSLGGVIGTGLFFNTGYIISTTGALGTLLAYLIGALVVYLVMLCLGELSVAMPETGAFHVYASRYLGPATGYTVAWLYWLTWTVALGSSLTAAGFCMQYWFPQSPVWLWCLIFCAAIFLLNVVTTRFFAESEFWFSLIKVITILAFIILGGAAMFGLLPMKDGTPAPFLHNLTASGWLPNGTLPILMTMVAVNFAFSGTELIGIAAGETENPEKVVPWAIRTTVIRLMLFFVGTVFILAALIPMDQAGIVKSPFVLVFERIGVPYAADIFNFVILTAILSAANSGLYASGRMLWSLANQRTLPAYFSRVNKRGIPINALTFSMLGGVLALLTSVIAPDTVFVALSAISGFAVVAVWLSICASHYAFRRHYLRSGQPIAGLKYRAPGYPLTPIVGFSLCLLACVGLAFDPEQRIALYCGLPFVALCYAAYYLTRRSGQKNIWEKIMSVNNSVATLLATHNTLILDGALATELEARGCDLSDPLWSAKVLIENPELIYQVHLDYFNAGAQCAITASYQATPQGFLRRGLDHEQSLALIAKSVHLAQQARSDFLAQHPQATPLPIAGSVGPYGAYLADGSEYRGDYALPQEEMIAFHRPRIRALAEAGVDLLACETLPSFTELQALLTLLQEFPTLGAWFAFTLRDSQHLSDGTPLTQVLASLHGNPQALAIGINCIALENVAPALRQFAVLTDKPLLVYPNSGEHYDAVSKTWHACGGEHGSLIDQVGEWQRIGARLIGGCCRTTPKDIRQIAALCKA